MASSARPKWVEGSLEHEIEQLVMAWDKEITQTTNPDDFKTFDPRNFRLGINGKWYFTMDDVKAVGGSYNAFLHTSLPPEYRIYDPEKVTMEDSMKMFRTVFPHGFIWDVIKAYSPKPVYSFKFRHWGYMKGNFLNHQATGEIAEFYGIGIYELDDNGKIVKVEFFYDRGELLGDLIKGKKIVDSSDVDVDVVVPGSGSGKCPLMKD